MGEKKELLMVAEKSSASQTHASNVDHREREERKGLCRRGKIQTQQECGSPAKTGLGGGIFDCLYELGKGKKIMAPSSEKNRPRDVHRQKRAESDRSRAEETERHKEWLKKKNPVLP